MWQQEYELKYFQCPKVLQVTKKAGEVKAEALFKQLFKFLKTKCHRKAGFTFNIQLYQILTKIVIYVVKIKEYSQFGLPWSKRHWTPSFPRHRDSSWYVSWFPPSGLWCSWLGLSSFLTFACGNRFFPLFFLFSIWQPSEFMWQC